MPKQTSEKITYSIQLFHPEKILARMPGLTESVLASIFGIELEVYREIRKQFRQHVTQAAKELISDSGFVGKVDTLPFRRGEKIVALGDSLTDDYQSWIEIFREVLRIRRPDDQIELVNAGISGDTTSQMISRFLAVVIESPDWLICFAGTNDSRTHGESPTKTLVSVEETEKNLSMLRNYGRTQTSARWLWMTPARVLEEKIESHWFLGPLQVRWTNKNMNAVADLVRQQPEPVVDLQEVFGNPPNAEFLLDDGLHPSLEGQKAITRALVEHLSGLQA